MEVYTIMYEDENGSKRHTFKAIDRSDAQSKALGIVNANETIYKAFLEKGVSIFKRSCYSCGDVKNVMMKRGLYSYEFFDCIKRNSFK